MTIAMVIPAAGIGSRMQADKPKQYLDLSGMTVLEHTALNLLQLNPDWPLWLALAPDDDFFQDLALAQHPRVTRVTGGAERAHSVLNALLAIDTAKYPWVLVHDAARPLVQASDIQQLISRCLQLQQGGILACPVRDTMKRGQLRPDGQTDVLKTESRTQLWHALTPQFFPTALLTSALQQALAAGVAVTDEASAMEWAGYPVLLQPGRADNIKITQPEDLALARFYLEHI